MHTIDGIQKNPYMKPYGIGYEEVGFPYELEDEEDLFLGSIARGVSRTVSKAGRFVGQTASKAIKTAGKAYSTVGRLATPPGASGLLRFGRDVARGKNVWRAAAGQNIQTAALSTAGKRVLQRMRQQSQRQRPVHSQRRRLLARSKRNIRLARQRSKYMRWVQSALNDVLRIRLPLDGIAGPGTRHAIRRFQQRFGLRVDGIADLKTRQTLSRARAQWQRRVVFEAA